MTYQRYICFGNCNLRIENGEHYNSYLPSHDSPVQDSGNLSLAVWPTVVVSWYSLPRGMRPLIIIYAVEVLTAKRVNNNGNIYSNNNNGFDTVAAAGGRRHTRVQALVHNLNGSSKCATPSFRSTKLLANSFGKNATLFVLWLLIIYYNYFWFYHLNNILTVSNEYGRYGDEHDTVVLVSQRVVANR